MLILHHLGHYLLQRAGNVGGVFQTLRLYLRAKLGHNVLRRGHTEIGRDEYFFQLFHQVFVYSRERLEHRADAGEQRFLSLFQTFFEFIE